MDVKKYKSSYIGISERSVRNYCTQPVTLLDILRRERENKMPGGIYHKIQVDLTYNSNHMEDSRLTHDQTRHIFETNTIGITDGTSDSRKEWFAVGDYKN